MSPEGEHSAAIVNRSSVKLFVSHSGFDKPIVRAITSQLKGLGFQVWLDESELVPGDRILPRLEEAVMEADFMVLFLSDSALRSTWVDEEWRLKFEQQIGERRVRVIPVLLDEVSLPPVLRGRLHVKGSAVELLREAARQIDRGVLEHLRRDDHLAGGWAREPLVGEATVAAMREEFAETLHAGRPSWRGVTEVLLCARAVAAAAYDAGDAGLALSIYNALLEEVSTSTVLWSACPQLDPIPAQVQARVEKYLREGVVAAVGEEPGQSIASEAWSARMNTDAVIDCVQAIAIVEDFFDLVERLDEPGFRPGPSYIFEPLRYAVHRREDKLEPLSPATLEKICAIGVEASRVFLESHVEAKEGPVDLRVAAILRMVRGGSLARGPGQGVALRSPRKAVEVVEDALYLNMMLFNTDSFIVLGGLGSEYESLMDSGATAVFDRALENRGYPRDADYWLDGTFGEGEPL